MKPILSMLMTISLSCCSAQHQELRTTSHGLKMMLTDVPKEQLIDEVRFQEGFDRHCDIIRFDHIGPSLYPLIVSSRKAVPTDSLGLISFHMQKDSLRKFLKMIDGVNQKVHEMPSVDMVLIRVTYRLNDTIFQYYVTNPFKATKFLRMIEEKLIANGDLDALDLFYEFIGKTDLRRNINGVFKWVY